jgi:hypothetical protein
MKPILSILLLVAMFALAARAWQIQSFDVPTPIAPGSTNALAQPIDLREAKSFAIQVTITATNAGTLSLVASNSLDNATWAADTACSFAMPYTAGTTSMLTNFVCSAAGFETYSIVSSATNSAVFAFGFKTSSKPF